MNILNKLKETTVSVLPIMLIVLILGIFAVHLETVLLIRFVIGGILLIAGLTIFLLGVDLGIQPLGERSGSRMLCRCRGCASRVPGRPPSRVCCSPFAGRPFG